MSGLVSTGQGYGRVRHADDLAFDAAPEDGDVVGPVLMRDPIRQRTVRRGVTDNDEQGLAVTVAPGVRLAQLREPVDRRSDVSPGE